MKYSNVVIEGLAYIEAPHHIESKWIEDQIKDTMERIGIPQGQLERLTGIKERRFWDPEVMPSDVATLAARKVMEETKVDPADLGLLVNTSVSKDYLEPSVASLVHGNLKLHSQCQNLDIGNACLGFVNGIDYAALLIESGIIKKAIIVNGESSREICENTIKRLQKPSCTTEEFRNNFASLTLGSGAVAMIVSHKDCAKHQQHKINGSASLAATEHSRLCLGNNQKMVTDASMLLVAGVELACRTWKFAEQKLENWTDDQISLYVPHQVSVRHTEAFCSNLKLDFAKFHLNVQKFGNIGPAALPITLAMADDANRCIEGEQIGLVGIGSGLNCTMMSVTW
ncbi:MAG: 3-oxoacyl-ACP synthase III [Acidobacteria bacterium]|nr:MAG: 3-oxoacyl-ACP synthase III [Acidobacteriota bacterium]